MSGNGKDTRWDSIRRDWTAEEEVERPAAPSRSSTPWPGGRGAPLGTAPYRGLPPDLELGRAGRADGQSRRKGIYVSGWQVAGDANLAGDTYPDQSLYPREQRAGARAPPEPGALARRPDREGRGRGHSRLVRPGIVADAEAGFGGNLNSFELMSGMIEAKAPQASTSKTSSPRRRNAGTSGARCSCRLRSSSAR